MPTKKTKKPKLIGVAERKGKLAWFKNIQRELTSAEHEAVKATLGGLESHDYRTDEDGERVLTLRFKTPKHCADAFGKLFVDPNEPGTMPIVHSMPDDTSWVDPKMQKLATKVVES